MQTDNVTVTDNTAFLADRALRVAALADYFEEPAENFHSGYDHGTVTQGSYHTGRGMAHEWLVLTDDEATERARDYIRETLWAVRASFLADYIPAMRDEAVRDAVAEMTANLCESANEIVAAMLGDKLGACIDGIIAADGRGPSLAGYDHNELRHEYAGRTWYIYRTN